jgi:hypothetical protein
MRRGEARGGSRGREYESAGGQDYLYHGRGVQKEEGGGGRSRSGGVFRRNPTLLLILVDILLILLVAGLLYPFLSGRKSAGGIAGFGFELHAYREGRWIYANVVVEATEEPAKRGEAAAGEQMEIIFRPPNGERVSRHRIVPPRAGDPQIVRSRIEGAQNGAVRATVRYAGEELELRTQVEERP